MCLNCISYLKTIIHHLSCSNKRFIFLHCFPLPSFFTQNDEVRIVNIFEVECHATSIITDYIGWMFNVPIRLGRVSSLKNVCLLTNNTDWSKYIGLSFCGFDNVFFFLVWNLRHASPDIFRLSRFISSHCLSLFSVRFSLHHCLHLKCEHVFYIWHMDGKNRGALRTI